MLFDRLVVEMNCSEACKLAGFKSKAQVSSLSGVPVRDLFREFESRLGFRRLGKSKFPVHFRRAMDAKHQEERRIMELAIVKIMKKEAGDD